MDTHIYVTSDPLGFDSNCVVCGGKLRDSVHGRTDAERLLQATALSVDQAKIVVKESSSKGDALESIAVMAQKQQITAEEEEELQDWVSEKLFPATNGE